MNFPFAKEQEIFISGPVGQLQAAIHQGDREGFFTARHLLVIVCHPHPVHGGTMDNKVVTTLMRTYRDLGIHVLRFNFRGVGKSEGSFDNAVGEVDDLLAVIAWAKQQLPQSPLLLAGFSFGSSIAAQASYQVDGLQHLTLVAPPVERYPYDREGQFPSPLAVIQGDKDERVIAEGVYQWVATLQSPAELLRYPEAGHFFHGYLTQIKNDLTQVLLRQIPAA
ncbi:alpha/beta hydrolase [Cellvibrio fibrivorans]|uniref:Alpha/beta superfamily hydrolase n=1 Tax=Cellvibrio fibrivorans TaxID=126350 RepID=A0ABU1V2W3_9GAMM|nr:alpha/beta fold hydrolase [Cellvibrio fibrivorans]MDR7091806.1 alpha/beta superfamily hydrolase [Cellvibrio fibrivorans]